jgi:hypothetical protein
MENLFKEYRAYEQCKHMLQEPLDADKNSTRNDYCHEQTCCAITDNKILYIDKLTLINDIINKLYFIYTDFGKTKWDDKYWLFIGKLKNGLYFSYESDCCGTGFGLASKSSLYLSKKKDLLYQFGLTNVQREFICSNICQRFIYV